MENQKNIPQLRFPYFAGEWEKKKLGEVSSGVMYGMNAAAKEYDGVHKYIRITDIDENSREFCPNPLSSPDEKPDKRYKLKAGDIVFARTGASVGKSYLYKEEDGDIYFAGFLIRFTINKAIPFFVYTQTLLRPYDKWVKIMSMRSGQPGVNAEEFKTLNLSFPTLPEQQKIASFFTAIDQKISQLKRKKTLLEQYKKGVMQKIFSQEIRFKDDNGQEFPKWEKKRLSEIFIEINETVGTRDIPTYSITAGVGFVSQNEKFGRNISGQQNKHYTVINEGQFSYNKGNSKTYTYGCIYVNDTGKRIAVPNVFISFEFIDQKMSSQFYSKLFESHYLDKGLRKIISSSARMDGLLNVNKNSFFQLSVPCPNYIEQQKIGHFLYSIDSKIFHIKNQIEKAEVWKKGLMQQMFV